jgi:hypothetical protein
MCIVYDYKLYSGEWCGQCVVLNGALKRVATTKYQTIEVSSFEAKALHGVRNIPTLKVFDNGKEILSTENFNEIIQILKQ